MRRYNIHGFVELCLDATRPGWHRYFDNEYARLHALAAPEAKPRVRVTVHIVATLPPHQAGDWRHERRFKRLFTFRYLIRDFATDDVHVYFERHVMDRLYVTAVGVFLQGQVLEPVLYGKLLDVGVLLLHAAGVADKVGYLLPARGGTGKTTLSLALARRGFRLLGDDLLFVHAETRTVYAYPRPLHLFTYNLAQLGRSVPWGVRLAIRWKDVLRFVLGAVTGQEFLISTRAHVERVMPDIAFAPPVPVAKVVLLSATGGSEEIALRDRSARQQMAERIVELGDVNRSLCEHVLINQHDVARVTAREREVAMAMLADLESVAVVNARSLGETGLDALAEHLRA